MAPRRSWAKANSPCRLSQVACWLSGNVSAQEFCRQRDLSIRTFDLWMHHMVSSGDCANARKSRRICASRRSDVSGGRSS